MRRPFGQALRLGVAADGVALVRAARWRRATPELVATSAFGADGADTLAATADAIAQVLGQGEYTGWPLTVVLADELVRTWRVLPPPGAARVADLEAASALRFHTLYGDSAAGWQMAASWDQSHPFLAAAVPKPLMAVLEQAAARQRLALVSIVPQFVANWNRWRGALARGAWFGQLHEQVLTLGALEHGRLAGLRAALVPPGADGAWLGAHLAREAMLLDLAAPATLQLVGKLPTSWRGTDTCSVLAGGGAQDWPALARLACSGAYA